MFTDKIKASLQRISIGSYVFQSEVARAFDLFPTDLEAISHLSLRGDLSAGELSELLGLTSGATTTLIDRLVERGFVQRARDKADARRVLVRLRGPRLARLRARYAEIEERIENALAAFSESDQAAIATFLSLAAEVPKTETR